MGSEETYTLKYLPLVTQDIAQLDSYWSREILSTIEGKLATTPELYGAPLRQTLRGYRKLRVGDYRVIYRIEQKVVRIMGIIKRSSGYGMIEERIRRYT